MAECNPPSDPPAEQQTGKQPPPSSSVGILVPRNHRVSSAAERRHIRGLRSGIILLLAAALGLGSWLWATHDAPHGTLTPGIVDAGHGSTNPEYLQLPARTLPEMTAARAHQYYSAPWKLLATDDADSGIGIAYPAGIPGCASAVGQYVAETADAVLIAVLTTFSTDRACPSVLDLARTTIHLQKPLAGRRLVHAVVDPQWPTAEKLFHSS